MLEQQDISFYASVFKELALSDIMELAALARTRTLQPGEVYIQEGSISQSFAYIKSGLLRTYCIKDSGEEVTIMMRWETQFFASIDSIIFHQPSRFIYQAVEETTLLEMDYYKALPIIDKNPALSASRHTFLLHMLGEAFSRVEKLIMLTPQERYENMLSEKPDIVNRIPDKYIATILGITPVSLSRIRQRIAGKAKR